jgi:hypothetical protein
MYMSSAITGGTLGWRGGIWTEHMEIVLLLYPREQDKFISLSQNLILRRGNWPGDAILETHKKDWPITFINMEDITDKEFIKVCESNELYILCVWI